MPVTFASFNATGSIPDTWLKSEGFIATPVCLNYYSKTDKVLLFMLLTSLWLQLHNGSPPKYLKGLGFTKHMLNLTTLNLRVSL